MKTLVFVLIMVFCAASCYAQGNMTPGGIMYVETDGATVCPTVNLVAGASWTDINGLPQKSVSKSTVPVKPTIQGMVGIRGTCIGRGKGFVDIRSSIDGKTIRCDWKWDTKLGRDAKLLIVGTISNWGHLDTREAVLYLSL